MTNQPPGFGTQTPPPPQPTYSWDAGSAGQRCSVRAPLTTRAATVQSKNMHLKGNAKAYEYKPAMTNKPCQEKFDKPKQQQAIAATTGMSFHMPSSLAFSCWTLGALFFGRRLATGSVQMVGMDHDTCVLSSKVADDALHEVLWTC